MLELITDCLEAWTSVVRNKSGTGRDSNANWEIYGVKKLRELILALAVRGKLVAQDTKDEPASMLLKRIAEARKQLIEEGRIRKLEPLPDITDKEYPYQLPDGWAFVRLGDLAWSQAGFAFESRFFNESGEGLPLIRIRDVGQPFSRTYYSGEYRAEFLVRNGDYLVSMDGEFRVSQWDNGPALLNQRVSRLIFFDGTVRKRLLANGLEARLRELQGAKAYTTVDHLSGKQIAMAIIGLPPEAEQHRIVAKVDALMALCDKLEQAQAHSLEVHQTLVDTLLGALLSVVSEQQQNEAWARIADNFDTLFTTEQGIDQLKQTVLQLAIMGRLVPQDPNEEPASVLLNRVAEAKQVLIELREILEPKTLAAIDPDAMPFPLPNGWRWAYVWDVAKIITSGSRDWAKFYSDEGALFVTMGNLSRGDYRLRLDSLRYVNPPPGKEGSRTRLEANDLLISITGEVGNLGLVPEGFPEAYINQHTCLVRFMPECQNRFFPELMRSPWAKCQFDAPQRGVKNSFRLSDVGEMVVPIPPLAEQHRIVAKVDELMALINALKAGVTDARRTQLHLADAMVEQAIA